MVYKTAPRGYDIIGVFACLEVSGRVLFNISSRTGSLRNRLNNTKNTLAIENSQMISAKHSQRP